MESLTEKIDEIFAEWDKPDSPGCALAVMKDGEIIYKKGYGMANLEYDIPITPETILSYGVGIQAVHRHGHRPAGPGRKTISGR